MAGDHVCGHVGTVLQALSQNIQAKTRLHVWPYGGCWKTWWCRPSTHTAGKFNTKEDLPQKFLLPQKVQHNLMDLINLCCDTSGPVEKFITETETKNRVSTFMPTRLGGHGWRPCMWLCKGQCCRHCHKTYKQKLGFMYGLMVVVERLGHVGISTHCREI